MITNELSFSPVGDADNIQVAETLEGALVFKTGVGGGNETRPECAMFTINAILAAKIVSFAAVVKANDFDRVVKFYSMVEWLKSDPAEADEDVEEEDQDYRSELDRLIVSDEEFWFRAYPKHGDDEFLSDRIPLAAIATHFSLALP